MPTFAFIYHVSGSDQKPQESVDADSLKDAADTLASKFETPGAIVVPSGEELVVIPKSSVSLCHIRQIQERRKPVTRTRNPFEAPEDEEEFTPNFVTPGS